MTISIFQTSQISSWSTAKKTQDIMAKPASELVNQTILSSMLLDTLEGHAKIAPGNFVCRGKSGDVWQQTMQALHKKYFPVKVNEDGWVVFSPKPENSVECFELVGSDIPEEGYIIGAFGSKIDGFDNVQSFYRGDFVCRQIDNHADQWIVRRGFFLNSYEVQ